MNATQAMELYNTLFYVCMTVAILGLVAAAALFFALDIPTVFALLTGRAKRKTVERIAKDSRAGKVHRKKNTSQTLLQVQTSGDLKKPMTEELPISEDITEEETSLLNESAEEETSLLSEVAETGVLTAAQSTASNMTRAIFEEEIGSTEQLKSEKKKQTVQTGLFEITESIIEIHTQEIII